MNGKQTRVIFNIVHNLQGDSGGGLVRSNVVIGIVSDFFDDCGSNVDEYTNVYEHKHWIKDILDGRVPRRTYVINDNMELVND